MTETSILFVACIATYTAIAAVTDLRMHRIPNWLTVPAAIAGLAFHAIAPQGWGWTTGVYGFALGFSLLLLPWILGGGGAGDVKLLAALGAWLGPMLMIISFAISAVFAGVMVLAIMTYAIATKGFSHVQQKKMQRDPNAGRSQHARRRLLPFAVPVALSTWMVLAWIVMQGAT